jgi:hypothetical protein
MKMTKTPRPSWPVLSRFLGWRYDGSEQHARRRAAQLPVIAFRPAAGDKPLSGNAGAGDS